MPLEDLEFDMNHDLERLVRDTDELTSFDVVLMANDDPDIRVINLKYDSQVAELVQRELGGPGGVMQTIINNNSFESRHTCPFFRIFYQNASPLTNENLKLKAFLDRVGMNTISSRCTKALVVGMAALQHLESAISMPSCFTTTQLELVDFPVVTEELDMACLAVCAEKFVPEEGHTLCDVAGVSLPCHLPDHVQSLILSFLREPTAELIQRQLDHLCDRWDNLLFRMFLQREPRIPAHIACSYHAATVQQTIADATEPFLVPAAKASGNACPRRMNS